MFKVVGYWIVAVVIVCLWNFTIERRFFANDIEKDNEWPFDSSPMLSVGHWLFAICLVLDT